MRVPIGTLTMVLGVASSGGPPDAGSLPKPPPGPVTTAKSARARFEQFAQQELLPGLPTAERAELADILRGSPSVLKVACQDAHRTLSKTLGKEETMLKGSAAALDRPGSCWRLDYDGGLRSGVGGCLDGATGSVLAVWRIPEG